MLLKWTAGEEGAVKVRAEFEVTVTDDGHEPALIGYGLGSSSDGGYTIVFPASEAGDTRLTTTRGLGSLAVTLQSEQGAPESRTYRVVVELEELPAFEIAAPLLFFSGASFPVPAIGTPEVEAGAIEEAVVTAGTGSTALLAASPDGVGYAVGAGGAAVGITQVKAFPSRGIVGGTVTGFCAACVGGWRSPDGREGSWASVEGYSGGRLEMAGTEGEWTWTWTGVGLAVDSENVVPVPVFGAFAPIGDDWILWTFPP